MVEGPCARAAAPALARPVLSLPISYSMIPPASAEVGSDRHSAVEISSLRYSIGMGRFQWRRSTAVSALD